MNGATKCPVCGRSLQQPVERWEQADQLVVHCTFCGVFRLTGSADAMISCRDLPLQRQSAAYSHAIRSAAFRGRDRDPPLVTSDLVNEWWNHAGLPTPREQADNLVLWLGNELRSQPGDSRLLSHDHHGAIAGAVDQDCFIFVLQGLERQGLIEPLKGNRQRGYRLTFEGWDRYEHLRRGAAEGFNAFMAMQFEDAVADRIYQDCFKPAVSATGFRLVRLDERPRAGLIDDALRLDIRRARFLIADLTHANNGAYWEAGYAEGVGKPVIYTCEKSAFGNTGTHFDTNHHQTVIWEADQPEDAARRLKATIRLSLPDAKQED